MTDPAATHARAGKLAELLADTVILLHPHIAKLSEAERSAARNAFLEGMEAHGAGVVGGMVGQIRDNAEIPAALSALFDQVSAPDAQYSALLQQFFVFGVMFNLASASLAPFVQVVSNQLWKAFPERPLSPPDIATMVVRGIAPGDAPTTPAPGWATDMASESGLSPENMQAFIDATGQPPALQELFQLIRRGIISESQLEQGIREGDTRDEWIPAVTKLRYIQPSPADLVAAAVQNQMSYAAAANWAQQIGLEPADYLNGNPDWFQVLYDTHGRPPGPQELVRMTLRGIIPQNGTGPTVTSFEQGVSESDIKDKWIDALWQLGQYLPPPGEVRTLLIHGGIDKATAERLWQEDGIPAEIAAAYAYIAENEQITQDKALAKGDIATAVQEGLMTDADATTMLARIGYTDGNAALIVKMAHWRYELESIRTSVRTIGTNYARWKIDGTQAKQAWVALGLDDAQAQQLLVEIDVQRSALPPIYTAADVTSGFHYGVVDQAEAMSMLGSLGYAPWDAWFKLSVRNHAPLPDQPAR